MSVSELNEVTLDQICDLLENPESINANNDELVDTIESNS